MNSADSFAFEFMDMLSAPILTHAATWADSIPQRLISVIRLERLVQGMKKREWAGDAECVAFIMTRSFEAPMGSDWTDIYTHLSCKVCNQHWGEDHWDAVKAPMQLTDYQENYLLKPLRMWIYKKRREHVKASMKKAPEPKAPQQMVISLPSKTDILQEIIDQAKTSLSLSEKQQLWMQYQQEKKKIS